jgi:hypothetical protein
MDDSPRQKLLSLDDLVAEVQALHSRVSQLERELARVRIETTIPRASGREAVDAWPPLHEARPAEAFQGQATPDSPVRQVLTADDDTAARHLERLRASITRLREERARAAAEFRMLTRPRGEGEPTPAEAAQEPLPAPEPTAAVAPAPPLAFVAPATLTAAHEPPATESVEGAGNRPNVGSLDAAVAPVEVNPEPPEVAAALAVAPASPAPARDLGGHGVDVSTSFPTLAAARQALDEYAARLPNGTPADSPRARDAAPPEPPAEESPDAEWRRVRTVALDAELERNEVRRRRRLLRAVAMIGSVLLIGAAALALTQWLRNRGGEAPAATANAAPPSLDARATPPAAPPEAVPQPAVTPPAPVSTPSSGPVGTSGTGTGSDASAASVPARIELRTTREVWLRTSVDGRPFRERLVPGDVSLPFNPTSTFYVRAGDAGGVRVFVDGEDRGVLGPDGRVVTRNYPIAPRAEPVQPR